MTRPSSRVRVLFVCIGNACRSPMAESIARREAADIIAPSSAGLYPLGHIAEPTIETLAANNYSAEALSSKSICREAVRDADLIINLSGMPIEHLFSAGSSRLRPTQRVENWEVADPYGEDPATYQRILQRLEARVLQLAGRLRAEKASAQV
jgi:arsenate reductase (thioredoxin)